MSGANTSDVGAPRESSETENLTVAIRELAIQLNNIAEMTKGVNDSKQDILATYKLAQAAMEKVKTLSSEIEEVMTSNYKYGKQLDELDGRMLRFQAIAWIQDYSLQILGFDRAQSRIPLIDLLEYSKDKDAVIRLECVRVFGRIPDISTDIKDRGEYPIKPPVREIIDRLREISENDESRAVRLEAKMALRKFGIDPSHP